MNLQKFKSVGISTSRLDTWCCRRKFWYTINNWYNPNSNVGKNAYFGNLCHFLLEQILPNFELNKYDNWEPYLLLCKEYDSKNEQALKNVDEQDLEKDKGLAIAVIFHFVKLWFSEEKNILSDLRKNFLIRKSELNLKRIKVGNHVFNLKIDLVLQNKNTSKIWLLDFKGKSRFDESILLKKLSFDQQLLLYVKCFEIAYHKEVEGIYQLILRKPQLRMTLKDKTLSDFIQRVYEDVQNKPEHYFVPLSVLLNDVIKNSFNIELNKILEEIYQALEIGEQAFYKNTSFCDTPFTCDFLDACSSGNMDLYLKYF